MGASSLLLKGFRLHVGVVWDLEFLFLLGECLVATGHCRSLAAVGVHFSRIPFFRIWILL